MKTSWVYILFGFLLLITGTSLTFLQSDVWNKETPLIDVLIALGEVKPEHYIENSNPEMVRQGSEIVFNGKTKGPMGNSSGFVSRFYKCNSCHNTVREDPVLSVVDQEARLEYAAKNTIPYLQGSTFWAMVNRDTWYNDDYVKKYGDLVIKANKSLKESIQLCATVCSQGRALKDWEMNSILAYFWSLQLTMADLDLSDEEWLRLRTPSYDAKQKSELRALLKEKYLLKSPATFLDPPEDKLTGYGLTGRPEKGKVIFNLGCRHCHKPKGESDVVFNDSKTTYRWLNRHKLENTQLSIYEIIRHGTYAEFGHKEYMPHYTQEKMSNQQVEDLRAFIELKCGN
jgi:mono/diheme cytochrome c family protein